jgi:hypothetical protein
VPVGEVHPGDLRGVRDAGAPTPLNAMTPDRRFFFDGAQWQAVPLPPEVAGGRRRMLPGFMWLVLAIAAAVGGAIIFELIVTVGLAATHG